MDGNLRLFLKNEVALLKSENRLKPRTVLGGPQSARVKIGGRDLVMLSSNNYLGLADHPRLTQAFCEAASNYGCGTAAARALSGNTELHETLETDIAAFKGAESALVFNSGYTANVGVISCLMGEGDVIYSDQFNHGSIIDGCRLSKAETKTYPHNDMRALVKLLRNSGRYKKRMIVTDTVFSMEGSIAPLSEIVELAERFGVMVMADDAHGTGVLGDNGKGALEHCGVEGKIDVLIGTLGKALGCIGGCVTGSKSLVDYLFCRARSLLFTTSLPAPCAAAAIAAIKMVQTKPVLRKKLWENTRYFKKELEKLGFDTLGSQTPIVPVLVGDIKLASRMSAMLFEEGVYVHTIGYPYVSRQSARLRTILSSLHAEADLSFVVNKFRKVGKALGIIK